MLVKDAVVCQRPRKPRGAQVCYLREPTSAAISLPYAENGTVVSSREPDPISPKDAYRLEFISALSERVWSTAYAFLVLRITSFWRL